MSTVSSASSSSSSSSATRIVVVNNAHDVIDHRRTSAANETTAAGRPPFINNAWFANELIQTSSTTAAHNYQQNYLTVNAISELSRAHLLHACQQGITITQSASMTRLDQTSSIVAGDGNQKLKSPSVVRPRSNSPLAGFVNQRQVRRSFKS